MSYEIKLDLFDGPLDLLLYLIRKNDVDIANIPIAEVTEQCMQYIEMMKMLDLDIVGDFLVMAATLMHIKSKMLLPPDPTEEDVPEEDPREDLIRRLNEYQKFKEIAKEKSSNIGIGLGASEYHNQKILQASLNFVGFSDCDIQMCLNQFQY